MSKNMLAKTECCEVAETTGAFRTVTPAVDIYETSTGYRVAAEVPGAEQKDVSLSIEDGTLRMEARAERRYPGKVKYLRNFRIGKGINLDDIQADLTQGVLTITLPKAAAARAKLIEVRGSNN